MRLRHKPWATEELERHPHIVIQNPSQHKGKWKELFGNDHPIHVEVGTGKGQFLVGMGVLHPDINYIGIEKYDSVLLTAMERVKESEQPNVKFLNEDVGELLDFFSDEEIDRVYINFTDPWPKNRHEKRRLTYKGYLRLYEQLLKRNGEVHFKTDNQGLFEYSLESFANYGMTLHQVSLDLHRSNYKGNVMTEYEEKFSKKGMRIYRCEAQFRSRKN
ncbi:tRNA (guanosine(46)-N7)-methyltransferase TrmB [Halalkalibacter nanhaiisediminis]|uniref:tRNA (guanine-N(7)-)-methyltransferase n=1 Tax=Halalkalibacter nanhaiisediminis TaxID=688079 RepID=A0A562QJL4_9BACI|nr:tRNA (guanosine(46)-N7)-methyltransferase TrmB [Halalkalibacter nanhaiisediminis]TWI56919.1 tRNA (guanine-N(7)-)-methyltransferase [Halalkalibacter nanhaiisediminis]